MTHDGSSPLPAPPALDPATDALFLDFDGTLVDLADSAESIAVHPGLARHLAGLQRAVSGALAMVSGRQIADLDRHLAPLHFVAAGIHGLERRETPEGAIRPLAEPGALDDARVALRAAMGPETRFDYEDKGMALVLNCRAAPDLEAFVKRILREAVAGRDDLTMMGGKMIFEIHPAGMDKGKAVAALMDLPAFRGRRPVVLGDDLADEHAFDWVQAQGGVAVKVGAGPTGAAFRLTGVSEVHRWLGLGPSPSHAA